MHSTRFFLASVVLLFNAAYFALGGQVPDPNRSPVWGSDNDGHSGPAETMGGGHLDKPQGKGEPDQITTAAGPNLVIDRFLIVDRNAQPTNPVAGKSFWLRVDYHYDNPTCTPYRIAFRANGWGPVDASVTWGCGDIGTAWLWCWRGCWNMHHGGTYTASVTLDADNAVGESNESDNYRAIQFTVSGEVTPEWALVHAEQGRSLLGDGTDIIVGTMDDALDITHPWLIGNDSKGRPRLIAAAQNQAPPGQSPVNSCHATSVMGIVLAKGENAGDLTGLAPDARYVTAEFLNRAEVPGLQVLHPLDAAGFLVDHGAEVINMSWSVWIGSLEESYRGETVWTGLMADYLAYGRNIVCVAAVNQLTDVTGPTSPGSSRNVITVGGLDDSLAQAWAAQNHGPTLDGRSKPDLLGNDSENGVSMYCDWRAGIAADEFFWGTSFAAPFVSGGVAQMLDYGKHKKRSTDHLVVKAILMNSGFHVLDDDGSPWTNSPERPLDDQQGTGVMDLLRVYHMYSAGEQGPGEVARRGFDLGEVTGAASADPQSGRVVYKLGALEAGANLDITLVWDRHTFWLDANGNGRIDTPDSFYHRPDDRQDDLNLVLRRNGTEIMASRSVVDNVEHISLASAPAGLYEFHVERMDAPGSGDGEKYAVAWHTAATLSGPDQFKCWPGSIHQVVAAGTSLPAEPITVLNPGGGLLEYSAVSSADWLNVSPLSGRCSSEADVIDVTYAPSMPPGRHNAHITLTSPAAGNSPYVIEVNVTVTVPGDFDQDGDVDQSDFGHLQACLTGSTSIQPLAECQTAKLDSDDDVDLQDMAAFLKCYRGPDWPPVENCWN